MTLSSQFCRKEQTTEDQEKRALQFSVNTYSGSVSVCDWQAQTRNPFSNWDYKQQLKNKMEEKQVSFSSCFTLDIFEPLLLKDETIQHTTKISKKVPTGSQNIDEKA